VCREPVLPVLRLFPKTFLGRRFLFALSDQIGPLWLQVPIVFLLGAMAPIAGGPPVGSLFGTMLIGGATAVAMLFLGRWLLPPLFGQAARTKSPELLLSACLLVVIVASLVTTAIGFSAILGALIAGIVIAETEYRGEVEVITAPFRGLGLGIFLITVGMSVDFRVVLANWQSFLIALASVLAVKAVVTALLLRMSGARSAVAAESQRSACLRFGRA